MDRKVMQKIEEGLCEALEKIASNGIRSDMDVETTKHALSGLVKLKCLEEMESYEGGSSGRSNRSYRSYESEGGSMGGGSYRRDSRGRYADGGGSYRGYRDGSSGHGDIREKLQEMMEGADERDRQMIREMVNRM